MLAILMRLCAVTPRDVALMMDVHRRLAIAWTNEDEPAPEELWNRLYALHHEQEAEAARIIEDWEIAGRPANVDYLAPDSDQAARDIGWPSRASQLVSVGLAQAALTQVKIKIVDE